MCVQYDVEKSEADVEDELSFWFYELVSFWFFEFFFSSGINSNLCHCVRKNSYV